MNEKDQWRTELRGASGLHKDMVFVLSTVGIHWNVLEGLWDDQTEVLDNLSSAWDRCGCGQNEAQTPGFDSVGLGRREASRRCKIPLMMPFGARLLRAKPQKCDPAPNPQPKTASPEFLTPSPVQAQPPAPVYGSSRFCSRMLKEALQLCWVYRGKGHHVDGLL